MKSVFRLKSVRWDSEILCLISCNHDALFVWSSSVLASSVQLGSCLTRNSGAQTSQKIPSVKIINKGPSKFKKQFDCLPVGVCYHFQTLGHSTGIWEVVTSDRIQPIIMVCEVLSKLVQTSKIIFQVECHPAFLWGSGPTHEMYINMFIENVQDLWQNYICS